MQVMPRYRLTITLATWVLLTLSFGCENNSGSKGNHAPTTVNSNTDPQLMVSPSVATLTSNQTTQVFAVSGGTAPYSWSESTPSLGTITTVNNDMATYTRTAASGQNGIHVRDAVGFSADATVNQTN